MKKYYFASGIRGIVGEHSGNIIGAKAKAQKLAEQLDEEITIFVRSNKEIDCGKNIPANKEVCRVCNADGDVLAVCSTYGNAFAWCAENGIEGEIGEYEPYIEVGTYSENGNFEVEDYSSINTVDGMWNIINDYCYYFDKVCPEATAETVESVEETTVSETVEETAEQETELNAEIAEVEAEQTADPETFSYEFNEIHKITISKRNNVYVEEFFEKMGGSYVKLGEEAWGCIEDIEEYYGIKINRNVQTDTEESESESESEPTVDSNTVETYQGNINVLIVADIANTFEMITHTGYFDTS